MTLVGRINRTRNSVGRINVRRADAAVVDWQSKLVSWWGLNETDGTAVADSHGSNSAEATGASVNSGGIQGYCRYFGANNHYINVGDKSDLKPAVFSLVFWAKTDNYTLNLNGGADQFGDELNYEVIGEPTTHEGAQELAAMDKFQFEWWALGLVGARPADPKKGADKGIDGRLYFHDDEKGKTKQVIISVKGGSTGSSHIRDLVGVLERENAQIGVLITLREPTQPMRAEAASAGFYDSPWGKHPKVQILTIEELLNGKQIDMPPIRQVNQTYKRAPRHKGDAGTQMGLLEE